MSSEADPDPYKVLGVDHAADPDVVAGAYRALARLHHPDVSRDEDAEPRMARINAAWSILRDASRRAAYDREHSITDGLGAGRDENPLRALHHRAKADADTAAGAPAGRQATYAPAPRQGEVAWRRGPSGEGAAGPPPGRPSGSVLPFGRHIGWSVGEIARVDPGYLQWLASKQEGAPYRAEIEAIIAPLLRTADGRGFLHPEGDAGRKRSRLRR